MNGRLFSGHPVCKLELMQGRNEEEGHAGLEQGLPLLITLLCINDIPLSLSLSLRLQTCEYFLSYVDVHAHSSWLFQYDLLSFFSVSVKTINIFGDYAFFRDVASLV